MRRWARRRSGPRHRGDEHVADQRVGQQVAPVVLDDDVRRDRLVERVVDIVAGDRGECGGRELLVQQRRDGEHFAGGCREALEATPDDVASVSGSAVAVAVASSAGAARRISSTNSGLPDVRSDSAAIRSGAASWPRRLAASSPTSASSRPGERHVVRLVAPAEIVQEVVERMIVADPQRAVGDDRRHALRQRALDDVTQQQQARPVRPLEILQHQDHRRSAAGVRRTRATPSNIR